MNIRSSLVKASTLLVFVSFAISVASAAQGDAASPAASPATSPATSPEDWKGEADNSEVMFGALMGLGVLDSAGGFSVLGTASKKIVQRGFAPDINNSVSIELQMGPLFISGETAFAYSTHLRWDFVKDPFWTFYALGGLAGHITGEALDSRFLLFPRFGVGVLRITNLGFAVRGEVSHEFITIGAAWPF